MITCNVSLVKNVFSRYSSAYPVDSGSLSEKSKSETHIEGLSRSPFIKLIPKPSIYSAFITIESSN